MKSLSKENRNYPRAAAKIELTYFTISTQNKNRGQTKDFSATGISFPVVQNFQTGDMVNLELSIPDLKKIIKTKATVMRIWPEKDINYVSVQFFDIDYHDFITLLDYSLQYNIEN
jgi:c-di-GMP-binding flagellar brake protein YcgR